MLASRSRGLRPPVDGVTTAVRDYDVVRDDATAVKAMGFGGKLCIHPAQVDVVARAFAPSQAELEWARRILDATEGTNLAVGRDGTMIDRPVIERARQILREALGESL